jgi:hypothetical protein
MVSTRGPRHEGQGRRGRMRSVWCSSAGARGALDEMNACRAPSRKAKGKSCSRRRIPMLRLWRIQKASVGLAQPLVKYMALGSMPSWFWCALGREDKQKVRVRVPSRVEGSSYL